MAKISIEKVVAMADALNKKVKPEILSDGRHRHSFHYVTVTLVNDFDFEAMTLNLNAGGLWYFYGDMEVFRIRRGEPVAATEEEVKQLESHLEWTTEMLNGLV